MGFLVGFDLDMTLLDTRPGIAATYRALTEQTGVYVDADLAVSRLGPALPVEMAEWFPADRVDAAVAAFRALYPRYAITISKPLPGAADAIEAVRQAGGEVMVVTAKLGSLARLHLDHVGLAVTTIVGDVWAMGKADVLRSSGAAGYVGDHVADVRAAVAAGPGVAAIAVATGPCPRADLAAAGADEVLADLTGFPEWLRGWLERRDEPGWGRMSGRRNAAKSQS